MRNVKFETKEYSYNNDDIQYAFESNGLSKRLLDIDVIVAEVAGENDGYDWYWILQMKDGTFSWAKGGCDYTGWDCQSYADIHDGYKTPEEAINETDTTSEDRVNVKQCLQSQIDETLPFGIYTQSPK